MQLKLFQLRFWVSLRWITLITLVYMGCQSQPTEKEDILNKSIINTEYLVVVHGKSIEEKAKWMTLTLPTTLKQKQAKWIYTDSLNFPNLYDTLSNNTVEVYHKGKIIKSIPLDNFTITSINKLKSINILKSALRVD